MLASRMIGLERRRPGQPSVVFLHGAGISSWMWRRQLEALPELDGVALDLPCHGVSINQAWESVPATAALVAGWIRANATLGRAHVVGLSLGGVVGLDLAARFPDVVDRMVTTGALGVGLPAAEAFGWLMEATTPWALRMSGRLLGLAAEDQAALGADIARIPRGFIRRAMRGVAGFRITPALLASPVPALVVAGTREYGGIKRTVARLEADWPQAEGRLVPKARHAWNWQYPDRFDEMLRRWLLDHRVADWLCMP